jgi:hypothetical protein
MTDQDRAAGLIHLVAGARSGIEALEAVVAEFAAVRLDERRAIVAAIKAAVNRQNAEAGAPPRLRNYATDLMRVGLGAIERGEHGS